MNLNYLIFLEITYLLELLVVIGKNKKKNWKKNLVSDILKNINSWEEFTKEKKEDYKYLDNSKDPGNPYGLLYQNNLVMIDTPRHDYYAKNYYLLKNKKNPLILEIGGGYEIV